MAYSCWAALSATYRTLSRSLPRGRCGPCFSMMPNGSRQVPCARAMPSLKSAAVSSSQCTESLFCEALSTWMASSNDVYTCPPRGPSKGVSNGIRRKKGVNDERRTSRPGAAERGVRPCGEIGAARAAGADHPEGAESELPRPTLAVHAAREARFQTPQRRARRHRGRACECRPDTEGDNPFRRSGREPDASVHGDGQRAKSPRCPARQDAAQRLRRVGLPYVDAKGDVCPPVL